MHTLRRIIFYSFRYHQTISTKISFAHAFCALDATWAFHFMNSLCGFDVKSEYRIEYKIGTRRCVVVWAQWLGENILKYPLFAMSARCVSAQYFVGMGQTQRIFLFWTKKTCTCFFSLSLSFFFLFEILYFVFLFERIFRIFSQSDYFAASVKIVDWFDASFRPNCFFPTDN